MINPGEMKNFPPEKVCVMISGTQGEPMSALSRAAVDNHKHAEIEKVGSELATSELFARHVGSEAQAVQVRKGALPARERSRPVAPVRNHCAATHCRVSI